MRIGILTDIHEQTGFLRRALDQFARAGVDVIVNLGDACDIYTRHGGAKEVAGLLETAGAVGVWGNHDVGLCHEVPARVRAKCDPAVLRYMATMRPRLRFEGCHFSHVEAWLDPLDVAQLWYVEGPPDTPEKAARSFDAVAERFLFLGHFHRWLIMTPAGRVEWDGERPIALNAAERYLVVIAPLFDGRCALFDTGSNVLSPVDLRDPDPSARSGSPLFNPGDGGL